MTMVKTTVPQCFTNTAKIVVQSGCARFITETGKLWLNSYIIV